MKRALMLIVVAVLLTGCAKKVWLIPPGLTQTDFERDKAQCLYEARLNTPPSGAYIPPAPKDRYGVSGAIATGFVRGLEEAARTAELFGLCMRARGYVLVDRPLEKPPPVAPTVVTPPVSVSPPAVIPAVIHRVEVIPTGKTFIGPNPPEASSGCWWTYEGGKGDSTLWTEKTEARLSNEGKAEQQKTDWPSMSIDEKRKLVKEKWPYYVVDEEALVNSKSLEDYYIQSYTPDSE
jgi:hypothetical protein